MRFAENFEELLIAFNRNEVNYMVVGGYAVNFHGYERNTSDLDIWVKSTKENIERIYSALKALSFDERAFEQIRDFDLSQPFLFHVGAKPDDIEVFNFVTGLKYEEAEPQKIAFGYSAHIQVYFISVRDLVLNKTLTGRTQDKLDVEMLQKIQRL